MEYGQIGVIILFATFAIVAIIFSYVFISRKFKQKERIVLITIITTILAAIAGFFLANRIKTKDKVVEDIKKDICKQKTDIDDTQKIIIDEMKDQHENISKVEDIVSKIESSCNNLTENIKQYDQTIEKTKEEIIDEIKKNGFTEVK